MKSTLLGNGLPSIGLVILLLMAPILHVGDCLAQDKQAASCKLDCKKRIPRHKAFIEIDANTGERIGGTTRFANGEDVQVIFVNKNPFKYHYRFQITSTPLDQAIATSFLKLIPGFGDLIDQALGSPAKAAGAAAAGASCPGAQTEWNRLAQKAQPLTQTSSDLKALLKNKSGINEVFTRFVTETDRESIPNGECGKICDDASSLNQHLSEVIDLSALPNNVTGFKKAVDDLQPLIEAFDVAFGNLSTTQQQSCDVADDLKAFKALRDDAARYVEATKKLQDNKDSFQQIATVIGDALSSDNAFTEEQFPYTAAGPTAVAITIYRTNLRQNNAAEKQVGQPIALQVGEPNLFFTAGIGFSTVSDRHVIRTSALVSDGKGGTKLGSVFGFEENSNFKPSGVFMLNAPLKTYKGMSFGPGAGLVISNRNGTTEAEFIAALSLGLLRNTVFISSGFHAARREVLSNGFKIGQEIPADLKDPLPTEKRFTGGAMFAITYRIK